MGFILVPTFLSIFQFPFLDPLDLLFLTTERKQDLKSLETLHGNFALGAICLHFRQNQLAGQLAR